MCIELSVSSTSHGQPVRNPNWSLGKYVGTEVRYVEEEKKKKKGGGKNGTGEEESSAAAGRVIDHIIDRFQGCVRAYTTRDCVSTKTIPLPLCVTNHGSSSRKLNLPYACSGQRCDETGTGRQSTVRFFCCAEPRDLPPDAQEVRTMEL